MFGTTTRFLTEDDTELVHKGEPGLPLGFWHRRFWPTVDDRHWQPYDNPVLKNPGPSPDCEMFPTPISFYEDVHQEQFWSIAVRQFGHSIMKYRSATEGVYHPYGSCAFQSNPHVPHSSKRVSNNLFNNDTWKEINNRFTMNLEAL